jgi:adenine deaminase
MTIAKGQVIAENGEMKIDLPVISYPEWATQSVHLKRLLTRDDFRLHAPVLNPALEKVTANVIGVVENQALTCHLRLEVPVNDNEVHVDMKRDLAKIALIERHHGSGSVTVGLVHGFGFTKPCAVASTVAHDSHQMLVLGTDEASMAIAANKLAEVGGGQVVVKEGQVAGMVELSIGGLMSTQRAAAVARKVEEVLEGFRACGCKLSNANMQLSLLALVVIPELRISDKGLIDVNHFEFVPVLEHP